MFSWLSGGKKASEAAPPPPAAAVPLPPPAKTVETPEMPQASPPAGPERAIRQLGLFAAGATFLMMSTLVTRRAVARKMVVPAFYQPSAASPAMRPADKDPLVAAEALGLATINVFSFAIMATGGLMWGFDISTLEELRAKARTHMYGAGGRADEAAEQELEEWAARLLSRLERKKEGDAKEDGGQSKGA